MHAAQFVQSKASVLSSFPISCLFDLFQSPGQILYCSLSVSTEDDGHATNLPISAHGGKAAAKVEGQLVARSGHPRSIYGAADPCIWRLKPILFVVRLAAVPF